jgi:hypothetical protein
LLETVSFLARRQALATELQITQEERAELDRGLRFGKFLPATEVATRRLAIRELVQKELEITQHIRALKALEWQAVGPLRDAIVRAAERLIDSESSSDDEYDACFAALEQLIQKHRPFRKLEEA